MAESRISSVRSTPAPVEHQARGILAYVSCVVGGQLRLDGIRLRRTRDGRYVLSFPVRHDAAGRQHAIVRPVDDAARRAIEDQVLGVLGLEREAPP